MSIPAVPRLWPASTILCVATGPSLTAADIEQVQQSSTVKTIVINDAYRLARRADVIFASDSRWWAWHTQVNDHQFPTFRYSLEWIDPAIRRNVVKLHRSRHESIDLRPTELAGTHGGTYAINLAVHLGAHRILLLGYDLQADASGRNHFFGEHPNGSALNYQDRHEEYGRIAKRLDSLGISCVNLSRETALRAFPRGVL